MQLTKKELNEISGGISIKLAIIIGGAITFIIGIIDGIIRPLKCNK